MKTNQSYRYVILIAGVFIQFCYGLAYVWSIFQPYVLDTFQMDAGSASLPFGIFLACFSLGNITGGLLQKKLSSTLLIISGSFIMCLGLIFSSFIPLDQGSLLNLTYGVISGFGCGIAYNTSVATVQKWFPDKRGLVTGMLICSTGSFGLIMNPFAKSVLSESGFFAGIRMVGISLFVITMIFGWFIRKPAPDYMADYSGSATKAIQKQYTIGEVLRTKQYYFITLSMMLAVPAYFLINPMLMTLGAERGLSETTALLGVMIVAVMNTAGRLLAPWISDKLGRKNVLLSLFVLNMASILTLTVANNYFFLVIVSLVGFSYGGFMGMYPTITSDYFGILHNGINYGAVMVGYGIASISCPYLVKAVQASSMGTVLSFVIAAIASVGGFVLVLFIKKQEPTMN
jgi:OFA family oxalate/formate antiporter-like MFS transporter